MKTFVPRSGKEKTVCYIGYPGLTYDQLVDWTNDIVHNLRIKNRNRVVFPTVVLASEEVTDEFRKSMKFLEFRSTGARLGNECPMMADGILSASRGKTRSGAPYAGRSGGYNNRQGEKVLGQNIRYP